MIEDPGLDVPARLANGGVDGGLDCVTVTIWLQPGETLAHTLHMVYFLSTSSTWSYVGWNETREPFPGPSKASTLVDRSAGRTAN